MISLLLFFLILPISTGIYAEDNKKPIRIAYFADDAPWMFTNNEGVADGVLHDLWELWSEKSNVDIQFVVSSPEKIEAQLKGSEVDVLAYTPSGMEDQLRKTGLESVPIHSFTPVLFVRKSSQISSFEEVLAKLRVGYIKGYNCQPCLTSFNADAVNVPFTSSSSMAIAASKHEVDAILGGRTSLSYYLHNLGVNDEFQVVPTPLPLVEVKAVVAPGRPDLVRVIEHGVAKIPDQDRLDLIEELFRFTHCHPESLVVALETDLSPLSFINALGKPSGLFVDIWNLWSEKQACQLNSEWGLSVKT
ncbi:substrate-binding periplasmic protein [Endozoicomonas sp. GU-1]|uniref:substrate-binding periplasmic protein n=1 Tax=Endozoicomonas sp. GU-1 TaxID=3009078 RepID=UPI0022B50705|nr:transporter substrate-binding domain-containing protein [Endozoicomonas sp. GU-1]WBA86600.1 transporter substrate-binding domain-containing protein [Endozoicomonas sp. GU-1]